MATTLMQAFLNAGFKPVKPRKARERKVQKCHKCGSDMRYVEGTNVLVCTGEVALTAEDGEVRMVPCNHRFLFSGVIS